MTRLARHFVGRLRGILLPLTSTMLCLVIWQVSVDLFSVPKLILPSPSDIFSTSS